jgi:hypothetical protein
MVDQPRQPVAAGLNERDRAMRTTITAIITDVSNRW